jgi:diacylglycerol O-acyltransferase
MWRMGGDPLLGSSFANVMLLDSPPEFDRLKSRLQLTTRDFPRLRARVESAGLGPPMWVEDPDFDIDYHLRRRALPGPATRRQLLDLATFWALDPFDPNRPLWMMLLVENLRRGGSALLARLHHCVTDGTGALLVAASLLDDARSPPSSRGRPREAKRPDPARSRPEDAATPLGLPGVARSATHLVASATQQAATFARDPLTLQRQARRAAEAAASVARQVIVAGPAKSSIWSGRHSSARRVETLDLSLSRAKRCARRLSGTVNDVFVTAVAGGAAEYHRRKGDQVDELRMSMPVSMGGSAANAFVPTRVLVPAGIEDPRRRFEAVHQRLAAAKAEPGLALADTVAGVLAAIPDPLLTKLARQQIGAVDFAASNLIGPPGDVYLAGARMVADFPIGPTMGVAFNVTLLSYRSRLFLGINIDVGAVDEPGVLRSCISGAFEELLATGLPG